MVDDDVKLGENTKIFDPDLVNIFGCEIGDNTFLGPFVEITKGVVIGNNCKIESHSYICDSVTLEDEVFIGHGVMFTNDLYPQTGRHVVYKNTLLKNNVSVGTNSTILGGVTIGEYAIIGAGAVVTRNVPPFSIVAGNPAKILKQFSSSEDLIKYINTKQPARTHYGK